MSTSIHNGLVPLGIASLVGTDDDPVDTLVWRDGFANGLLHAADSYAQVRVNLSFPDTSSFSSSSAEFISGKATPTADAWYRIGPPFGPWPLTLHADGTPYRLRIRLGLSASGGGDAQTVRVVIAPEGMGEFERERDLDHVYQAFVASTTPAYVVGETLDTANETMLTVSHGVASGWMRNVNVYDAVSSASPRTVQQCLVCAHVFFMSANGVETTRLHALHLAEYVGT